jgi:hypothetical protein
VCSTDAAGPGLAAPAAGAAGITKRDPAGDVRGGAQIGRREHAALDIVGVTARRDSAGLAVDVRLRGDFERLAGGGALKDPIAGIVLRRKPGRPGTLLTRGPDRRAQVRAKRAGKGPVVVRDGRVVRFRVAGDVSTRRLARPRRLDRGLRVVRRQPAARDRTGAQLSRWYGAPGIYTTTSATTGAARATRCASRSSSSRPAPARAPRPCRSTGRRAGSRLPGELLVPVRVYRYRAWPLTPS